jgi:hypothetical protein
MRGKILIQGSLIRAGYGLAALLLPKVLFKAIGLKETDPDARYLNRLFGGRDLLVAGQTALAVRRGTAGGATAVNLIAEATDTVALVEEYRERGKLDRVLLIGLAFNVLGYLTWFRAALSRPVKDVAVEQAAELSDAVTAQTNDARKRAKKVRKRAAKRAAKASKQVSASKGQASKKVSDAGKRVAAVEAEASKRVAAIEAEASKQATKLSRRARKQAGKARDKAASAPSDASDKVVKLSRRAAKKANAAAEAAKAA